MSRRFLIGPLMLVATLFATVAAGATPRDVNDLVGARASTGDAALRDRGYVHITTQKSGDHSYGMWWNASTLTCVSVQTKNGAFKSITTSPAFDCNQHNAHSGHDDDNAAAAAAVVGAAAVIGAIALAHKSHHHDNDEHHQDSYREQEFERGHRDGLYNHHYDNYNRTDDYDNGYRSGIDQRAHETSYRQHTGRDDRGYRQANDDFKNLQGERLEVANDRMRGWGFQKVDHTRSGNTEYRIWYNYQTGQCVEETYTGDRVQNMRYIASSAHCR
jgi:hypothetical protein